MLERLVDHSLGGGESCRSSPLDSSEDLEPVGLATNPVQDWHSFDIIHESWSYLKEFPLWMRGQFSDGMTHDVQRLLWLYLERVPHGYQVSNQDISGLFCSLTLLLVPKRVCNYLFYSVLSLHIEVPPEVVFVGAARVGEDEVEVSHGEPGSRKTPATLSEGCICTLSNQPQQMVGVRREEGSTGKVKSMKSQEVVQQKS